MAMGLRCAHPFVVRRLRHHVLGPEISEDQAGLLEGRIGRDLDMILHLAGYRLGRQIDAIAGGVEFPAVIDAAQAAFLITAIEHRRPAVWTIGVNQTDAA